MRSLSDEDDMELAFLLIALMIIPAIAPAVYRPSCYRHGLHSILHVLRRVRLGSQCHLACHSLSSSEDGI
jgi:hypothetical protein